jgi:CspA family cold shock protein
LRLLSPSFPAATAPGRPAFGRPPRKKEIIMTIGTVKFFNTEKGFGFISPDGGGNDAFVHISSLERSGMGPLAQNDRVSYELEQDKRGKMSAVNLQHAE